MSDTRPQIKPSREALLPETLSACLRGVLARGSHDPRTQNPSFALITLAADLMDIKGWICVISSVCLFILIAFLAHFNQDCSVD